MKCLPLFLLVLCFVYGACTSNGSTYKPGNRINGNFFNGDWTYRSLLNDTAVNLDFDSLEFAAANLQLITTKDSVSGLLYWQREPLQGLKIKGRYFYQDSVACFYWVGLGDSTLGTPGWQYDYQGYVVPKWKEGIKQADVLVGSVVRAKKHSCNLQGDSCHPAGVVASIYLVRK